ncbi:serine hydrolase domain-containing protein [Spongiimicrobium salis]|uniref:serine hydrolase domain-containing protein n=1 Tax=Spongiimicrobium salis TaxID=1667022 RepID=UPI00374CAC7A
MITLVRKTMLLIIVLIGVFFPHQNSAQQLKKKTALKNLVGNEIHIDSINAYLERQMKTHNVPGVSIAIINDGQPVFHTVKGYANLENKKPITAHSIFEGASLSKPLFAYFVMGFVEDGLLNLDTPLHTYMPYPAIAHDERYKKITARMVLSHTTGFPNWRSDYKENKLFIAFEPGSSYQYSGEGYQYLAKVLAHLLKTDDQGLERIYQKKVANPLKLAITKFVQDQSNLQNKVKGYKDSKHVSGNDDPKVFGAAFSIHSEALDFSKWIIALMEQKGLSQKSFEQLFETQVVLPEDHPQRQTGITDWTLGFAKATLPFGTAYGHGGNNYGYTSLFVVQPESKWGFVIFTNADQSSLPLELLQYLMQ